MSFDPQPFSAPTVMGLKGQLQTEFYTLVWAALGASCVVSGDLIHHRGHPCPLLYRRNGNPSSQWFWAGENDSTQSLNHLQNIYWLHSHTPVMGRRGSLLNCNMLQKYDTLRCRKLTTNQVRLGVFTLFPSPVLPPGRGTTTWVLLTYKYSRQSFNTT